MNECEWCGGTGLVESGSVTGGAVETDCPKCGGTGRNDKIKPTSTAMTPTSEQTAEERGRDAEAERWGNRLDFFHKEYGADCSGCDSGDELDCIETEARQVITRLTDEIDSLRLTNQRLEAENKRLEMELDPTASAFLQDRIDDLEAEVERMKKMLIGRLTAEETCIFKAEENEGTRHVATATEIQYALWAYQEDDIDFIRRLRELEAKKGEGR